MPRTLTRRQLLKLIAASSVAAALAPALHARARYPTLAAPPTPEPSDVEGETEAGYAYSDVWMLKGRAIHTVVFYEEPDVKSERLDVKYRDEEFRILGEERAPFSVHNDLWYRTPLGYVHSAWVLPVRVYPPQPFIADVGPWGFWGEVAQIHTEARAAPALSAHRNYRFYGGTVHRVIAAAEDEEGSGWYKVVDDYPPKTERYHWVLARDVRRVPRAEMAPIHPFAGQKRIFVDFGAQKLNCYEGDDEVFSTLVAGGLTGATPRGEHCVLLKQPSRHMSNTPYPGMAEEDQPDPGDIFDLPGVPWNVFFDLAGTAIHGAYWHNDFGIRRSHGCLNVSSEAARWIYRWVHPIGGYEDDFIQSDCRVGTPIVIE